MRKNKIEIIFFDSSVTLEEKNLILKILEKIIKKKIPKRKVVLTVVIVSNETIKEINKKFRRINKVTSVLSFPLINSSFEFIVPKKDLFLGDIILNFSKIKKENKNFKDHLKKHLVHAFLHLLCYTHDSLNEAKIMEEEEKKLLEALNDI